MNAWRHGREIYMEKLKLKAEEKRKEEELRKKEEKELKEREDALEKERRETALKAEALQFGKIEQKGIVKEENAAFNIGEDDY